MIKGKNEEKVVVVGFSGRYGGATNPDLFWNKLLSGESFFTQKKSEKENFVNTYSSIDEVEYFDNDFFSMSPKESKYTDPQQRIFLETCYEVLENTGYSNRRKKKNIGVFASSSFNSYLINNLMSNKKINKNTVDYSLLIGNDKDFLATKVAYKLNLTGPATNIQNACSSSLAALNYACLSIANGECEAALVGGVSISFPHNEGYFTRNDDNFSNDGICRPFDENANGLVKGNGCSVILIKTLTQAIKDKDTIYALIDEININNDGSEKMSFTSPSVNAQEAVIKKITCEKDIAVDYIEAHGTGTKLGDPIELRALYNAYKNSYEQIPIGSVKANLGHLDVVAGLTSLVKALYMFQENIIPANVNLSKLNNNLEKYQKSFYFPTTNISKKLNKIAISSFGIGGTNTHVVLKRYDDQIKSSQKLPLYLIPISFNLESDVENIKNELICLINEKNTFEDIVYSLSKRAHDYQHTLFQYVDSKEDILLNFHKSSNQTFKETDFTFNYQEIRYILETFDKKDFLDSNLLLSWSTFLKRLIPKLESDENHYYKICDNNNITSDKEILAKFYRTLCYFNSEKNYEIDFSFLYRLLPWKQVKTFKYPMNKKYLFEDVKDIENDHVSSVLTEIENFEKMLIQIVSEVLEIPDVDLTDDFYELGGDSLLAIDILDRLQEKGLDCSLQDFLDNPILQDFLIALKIKNQTNKSESEQEHLSLQEQDDFSYILSKNKHAETMKMEENNLNNILLLGATGFLGAHLLYEMSKLKSCQKIYCLVRPNSKQTSENRLKQILQFYFSKNDIENILQKTEILSGNILDKNFGLSESLYNHLKEVIEFTINSAGSVEHYKNYNEMYKINVETVKNLLDFSKESKSKYIHMSTLAISGNNGLDNSNQLIDSDEKIEFNESNFYIGQPLDNVYVKTKYEAEKIIFTEMNNGLQASIFRIGNITNRRKDGIFQINHSSDAFTQRLLLLIKTGKIPISLQNYNFEFSPVDDVATSIIDICKYNMEGNVFHINNINYLDTSNLIECLDSLKITIKQVDDEDFIKTVKDITARQNDTYLKEVLVNDLSKGFSIYESNFEYISDFTTDILKSIGFEWKPIDNEYLEKYINFFYTLKK